MNRNYRKGPTIKPSGWLVIVLGLIFSTACSSQLTPVEKLDSIFAGKAECNTPCWQGITPGHSTESDFLALVRSSPDNEFQDLKQSNFIPKGIRYIWYDGTTSMAETLEISDTTVTFIGFQSRGDFSLGTILEYLGDPDAYTARVALNEVTQLKVYIFYENKGIMVYAIKDRFEAPPSAFQPICEVDLTNDIPIRQIYLVEPKPTDEIISSLSRELIILEESKPWSGLGTIELTSCPN